MLAVKTQAAETTMEALIMQRSFFQRCDPRPKSDGVARFLLIVAVPFLYACSSTSPVPLSIAGQTFDLLSIGGRVLPTTLSITGRFGTCDAQPVNKVSLVFGLDRSFVQLIVTGANTAITIAGEYLETRVGETLLINSSDTATVEGDTLRVRLSGINCGREDLIALRRRN